jgi:hypothetical protein
MALMLPQPCQKRDAAERGLTVPSKSAAPDQRTGRAQRAVRRGAASVARFRQPKRTEGGTASAFQVTALERKNCRNSRGTLDADFLGRGVHPRLPRVPTDTSAAVAGTRGFGCLLDSLATVAEAARIWISAAEPGARRLAMGSKRCEGR